MIWWLPHILLIAWNIANSQIDAYRILKHKTIAHGINLGAYLIAVGVLVWITGNWLLIPASFFSRQLTFDIPLNWRRGLKWDYVSLDKPPKALMDRIEVRVFGYNGRLPVLIYGIIWIVFLIIDCIL